MYGARRKFPKNRLRFERKFSFLSDFLPASYKLARKSANMKKWGPIFSSAGGIAGSRKGIWLAMALSADL